jgi:hypothetical protein
MSSGSPSPRRPSSSATGPSSSRPWAAPASASPPPPSASASRSSTPATRPMPPSSAAAASPHAISDNANLPAAESPGIATALFDPQPLGFRPLSLFVTDRPPSQTGTPANPVTHRRRHQPLRRTARLFRRCRAGRTAPHRLARHAARSPRSTSSTTLASPSRTAPSSSSPCAPSTPQPWPLRFAHSLTHLWIHSSHPWIDEGLAQFVGLLWTERTSGRAAALAQLQDATRSLALIEPETPVDSAGCPIHDSSIVMGGVEPGTSPVCAAAPQPSAIAGDSLADATGEVFYRTKAAAVWWMLRSIVGDDALKQALQAYRKDPRLDLDPAGLQRTLENPPTKTCAGSSTTGSIATAACPTSPSSTSHPASSSRASACPPDGWSPSRYATMATLRPRSPSP